MTKAASPVVGATKPHHVDGAVAAVVLELSDDFDGLREQVLSADMLAFATPLYYYGMAARSGYPEKAYDPGASLG